MKIVHAKPALDPVPELRLNEGIGDHHRLLDMLETLDDAKGKQPVRQVFIRPHQPDGVEADRERRPIATKEISSNEDLSMINQRVI